MEESNYFETNRKAWNIRTDIHIESEFYDNANFIEGKSSLNEIELNLLGDIKGKKMLHLQCHFGQDTISLCRLGAEVTGVDLSDKSVERAKELAQKTGSNAKFIRCNLYDLPMHLEEKFDLVYTSYGAITWLPDLDRWAKIISHFLKPGGQFVLVEFHPAVWMFDDNFSFIKYSYFNTGEIPETVEGTYASTEAPVSLESVTWNHALSEVVNSLLKNGLNITTINEYNYSPYNCVKHMLEFEPGKYIIKPFDDKVPLVFSIVASKQN